MNNNILVIDLDLKTYEEELAEWDKQYFEKISVNTMQEGIKNLTKSDFLLVLINAENIDYLPQLQIMSEVASAPVLITGSTLTSEIKDEALRKGADSFTIWQKTSRKNIKFALAAIRSYTNQNKRKGKPLKLLFCGEIFLALQYHKVFINDVPLKLTKIEFNILYYLMLNPGRVFTYKQIYRYAYKCKFDENTSNSSLHSAIKRLRAKIKGITPFDYIKTQKGIGYYISP